MDDLISRAAALDVLVTSPNFHTTLTRIEELPAVDAVPVIHAYWVEEPDRVNHWHCSNCGVVEGIHCMTMNYCPKCGARMAEHPWLASGVGQAFSPD